MINKKIIIILFIIALILLHNVSEARMEKDEKILIEAFLKTGLIINDIYEIEQIEKANIRISPWVVAPSSLSDSDYPSAMMKDEVRNTPTIKLKLHFPRSLLVSISFGKFKDKKSSLLAHGDYAPSSFLDTNTLFLGGTIENAFLRTTANDQKRFANKAGKACLIYKNCVCEVSFVGNGRDLTNEDFKIVDDLILMIKKIIDKSIK